VSRLISAPQQTTPCACALLRFPSTIKCEQAVLACWSGDCDCILGQRRYTRVWYVGASMHSPAVEPATAAGEFVFVISAVLLLRGMYVVCCRELQDQPLGAPGLATVST
jgi:hypothetical protein